MADARTVSRWFRRFALPVAMVALPLTLHAQKPRERDLELPIGGTPGPFDAITDVAGVEVGHATLISGSGALVVGKGPVRTGVTVIHPRGKANADPVFAAWFTLNGNGEMTGTTWVQESGLLEGPVAITNTHSVGVARDAIIGWEVSRKNALQPWWLPVVAETYDCGLTPKSRAACAWVSFLVRSTSETIIISRGGTRRPASGDRRSGAATPSPPPSARTSPRWPACEIPPAASANRHPFATEGESAGRRSCR